MTTKQEELRKLDQELWTLTRKMVAFHIPYHPIPKNLGTMEENNPKGYAILMEYVSKLAEYEGLKKNGEEERSQEDNH